MADKILITGGTGMVGSQFTGDKLSSLMGDLRNPEHVRMLFYKYHPEYVIHTAARVGGVGTNMTHQADFFYDNIMMNANIVHACRIHNVKRACFFLSTCVFPDKVEYPLTEDKIHLGPSHPSNYGYSFSKRAMQIQVKSYNEQYGTNYFCVIPCNIYGPGDNFNLESDHVIPSLIHKTYLARENGTDLEVWGDGSPLREFIFAKDVAKITERLLYETDFKGDVIVSRTSEHSIRIVVDIIVELMNFKGKVVWLKDKPNGQLRKPSDNSLLHDLLDDIQFIPLIEGLEETIEWFEQNYPNIRK